mmetsp:Transcript_763/g.1613  ORF Transcript_763/g.1613 Transcript_763/m.1613 type:complete len:225 (+) Transcript_763:636-1310(+)
MMHEVSCLVGNTSSPMLALILALLCFTVGFLAQQVEAGAQGLAYVLFEEGGGGAHALARVSKGVSLHRARQPAHALAGAGGIAQRRSVGKLSEQSDGDRAASAIFPRGVHQGSAQELLRRGHQLAHHRLRRLDAGRLRLEHGVCVCAQRLATRLACNHLQIHLVAAREVVELVEHRCELVLRRVQAVPQLGSRVAVSHRVPGGVGVDVNQKHCLVLVGVGGMHG